MKLKLMTLMIAVLALSAIHVHAQVQDESRIKVVPAGKPGVLKLIHAINTEEPIKVTFSNNDGIVTSDKITGSYPKGLLKRYDVNKIDGREFRMEVSSSNLTVTYLIVFSRDRKTFTPYLEKVEHKHEELIASRN